MNEGAEHNNTTVSREKHEGVVFHHGLIHRNQIKITMIPSFCSVISSFCSVVS